ncbi:2-C-methyl-D-erythritol 4-phosphate cytidylyltransferase [Undibacterium curvum]|uniref:2-C-methyl-D-erythritol 4-phosphate cytidylyltransferase n=1 Tax=Undibacterium curvum TaxID=2762294 RepID=A0ABR7A0W9_9BURK|nr:2-C-methyl-D-erythritol 4-phosphate cytidylyltransferase [Undibacterium curvum]MBC3930550.1 2-C-methyl-D-erythritol 4-phosphate cytidylyltransferase [Undibacterium curvum]
MQQTSSHTEKSSSPNYIALIPAAGVGARMGSNIPKQYLQLGAASLLQHTVNAFLDFSPVSHIYVVVSPEDAYVDQALAAHDKLTVLRCGGATRRDTVRQGLAALAAHGGVQAQDWVLVHDAARPGLTQSLLQSLLTQVGEHAVGGLLALPVVDTVKRVHADQQCRVETIPREQVWLAQTPQMFRYALLCDALDQAAQVTDESSAVEAAGYTPLLVAGDICNLKVTQPADLEQVARFMNLLPG